MTRVLNVAEKNDAAKCLADIMSAGSYTRVRITLPYIRACHVIPYVIVIHHGDLSMATRASFEGHEIQCSAGRNSSRTRVGENMF